jgi:hypothetical protein
MKKHILSKYSEKKNDGMVQFQIHGRTLKTRTLESSDPDEFELELTSIKKSVENPNPDRLFLGPTVLTESIEDSDQDEFLVDVANYYEEDFDSILLI